MKTQTKTAKIKSSEKLIEGGYRDLGATSCPAGAFDTSASPDARAAVIRNRLWATAGLGLKTWDSDYAAAPDREVASSSATLE